MNYRTEKFTAADYAAFLEELKGLADSKYREFHSSLVPTEQKEFFLGVRMPKLRELGREISKGDPRGFLGLCGDTYYEESMVRGIVTGLVKPRDFADFVSLSDSFIPYISNWALCDCFCSGLKSVKKFKDEFFEHILSSYIPAENPWAVRAGLVIMLNYYLEEKYIDRVLSAVDEIKSEEYYVKTAQAWLLATAAAKCREKTVLYLQNNSLDNFTQNKAIQKARESFRVDDDTKELLVKFKR